jgi:hypothetical protein
VFLFPRDLLGLPAASLLAAGLGLAVSVGSARGAADAGVANPAPASNAAAFSPGSEISTTVGGTFVSQYLYRGERLGGPSLQSWVEVDPGSLGLGVWTDFPLTGAGNPAHQSNPEIDPYAYYRIALSDQFALIPAFQVDTYPAANPGPAPTPGYFRTRAEPSLAAEWRFHGVTLEPKVAYDFTLRGATSELTGLYALPVAAIGSEVDLKATGGWFDYANGLVNASPHARAVGGYWLAGAELPFQLNRRSRLTLGWAYTAAFHNSLKAGSAPRIGNRLAAGRGVLSLSYAWTF